MDDNISGDKIEKATEKLKVGKASETDEVATECLKGLRQRV